MEDERSGDIETTSGPKPNADQADKVELVTDQDAEAESPRRQLSRQVVIEGNLFSGPIPPPETLEGYNTAMPNGADRVMKMAEQEQAQAHRHKMEEAIIGKETFEKRIGLFSAIAIATLTLVASAYLLIFTEKSGPGLTLFILEFVGLAWAFLGAQKQKRSDEVEETED